MMQSVEKFCVVQRKLREGRRGEEKAGRGGKEEREGRGRERGRERGGEERETREAKVLVL